MIYYLSGKYISHIMRLFSNVTTALFILTFVFTSSLSYSALPNLEASNNERALSNPSFVLGQYWFRKLNGSPALIDFPPAYDYLKETMSYILPQTDLHNTMIEMTLLNSSKSNAFVMPGNHLYLYADIMEMITSEEILMGLLAHEIAHLDLRHYERQSQHSGEERQKTLLLLGAGIAAALAGADSDASTALWLGGIANQAENTLTYSRNQEQEADRRGRDYLIEAQLSPDGMSKLFQALFKQALGRPKLEFLSTHPSPNSRLSDAFNTDTKKTLLNNIEKSDFQYFRASVLAYRAGLEEAPLFYLDRNIQDENARLFAKALFSYLIQTPQQSLMFLEKINTPNRFTDYIQALSFLAVNRKKDSSDVIQKYLDIDPHNFLFSNLKAQISQTKPIISPTAYLYEKRLSWRIHGQYYRSIHNMPMALYYHALLDFHQGKDKTAQNLLRRAQKEAEPNEMAIINNTIKQFDIIQEVEAMENLEGEQ